MSRTPWWKVGDFKQILLKNTISFSFGSVARTHHTISKANNCKKKSQVLDQIAVKL
jgi:hypothetical protein